MVLGFSMPTYSQKIWDFTSGLSDETIANLNADTENWSVYNTDELTGEAISWRYTTIPTTEPFVAEANGMVVKEVEGLSFRMLNPQTGSLIIYKDKIRLTKDQMIITFPQMKKGQTITIRGKSANNTATNRGIEPIQDYLTLVDGIQTDGKCLFLGREVTGSFGVYSFTWRVDVEDGEPKDVQFQVIGGGVEFYQFEIDGQRVTIPANPARIGLVDRTPIVMYAGTIIGSNNYMDVSLAFRDTCFNMIAPKWYYYSHFLIDGMPYTANGQHIIGEINPKDVDGNQPGNTLKAPVEGSVFTIDAKRDGYAYVWGVFSTSKAYSVFENGKAVGYRLSMIKEGNLASGNISDLGDNRIDIMFGQHNKPFTKAIPSPSMVMTGDTAKVNLYGEGVMMFPVKANNSYLVFGNGSNLIFGGVHYNENGQSVIAVGNTLEASEVLLDGITEPSITYTEPKGPQSLGITTLPSMIYGDAAYTLPTTTIEGLNLTWSINNSSVATITDQILTIVGAGTATVTATQAGNDSYLPFSREFTLTVAKAALTITANDCTRKRGEENPELTVSYDGFKNGDTKAVLKKQPTVTTTATVDSPTGEYPIIVSGAEADNYIINYVNGKLTVTPADTPVLTGNTLYVTDGFSVHQGENATLSIRLDNEDDMIMVEFYLQLPEGMHVNKDADGYFDVTLNSDRADRTHTVEVEQGTNGLYHVLAYSSRNKAFTGSEGELISMNIGCDANVGAGIYQGVLRSILMSKADKTAVEQGNRTFDIEVTDYILGDVNDDHRINGLDIVEIVDLVMGMGYKPAADLYPVGQPDGIVNGMDLVEEVSLVLSQTIDVTNGARQAESTPLLLGLMLTPTMNGSYDLGVNTADHFILAQLTLNLSDGMTLSDIETDGLHVAAYRPMGEGRYSVVVYSARNRSFIDNRQLLTLRCTGEGEVCVSDVMLIDDVKQARHFAAIGTGETTGIYGIKSSGSGIDTPVYDLQGRKVTIGRKGVYLMGSQKVVVR